MKTDTSAGRTLVDWTLYGSLIKGYRKKLGIKTADDFSTLIYLRTRAVIPKALLYRIESGTQEPTATQFMAINLTLFDSLIGKSDFSSVGIMPSICAEWTENDNSDMCCEWMVENIEEHDFRQFGFYSDDYDCCIDVDAVGCLSWDLNHNCRSYLADVEGAKRNVTATDEEHAVKQVYKVVGEATNQNTRDSILLVEFDEEVPLSQPRP